MSDTKPITGELRKYATVSWDPWPDARDRLYKMCDRIDAVHANLERENARLKAERDEAEHRGWTRGYDEGFASADDVLGVFDEYGVLKEHGWVKLHKDVDGKYIHEYDKVDWRDHAGTWHENATVVALCNDGCYVMYALDGMVIHVNKSDIRHHHVPTVEDVLREFALAVCKDDALTIRRGVVEEFAKRLQLAGDVS